MINDKDLGYKNVLKQLKRLKGKTLKVGIFSDAGVNPKSGERIVDYAYHNEYGTSNIPARSFIRNTEKENRDAWSNSMDAIANKIIDNPKQDIDRLVSLVGEQVVGDIREKISSNVPPPLSPQTIKKKKSTRTLIDTGIMRSSITYKLGNK